MFTYPWGAQSRGNCMFMAQITQTGHQQETLLPWPIYLRGKLSPSLSVQVFTRLLSLPRCKDFSKGCILTIKLSVPPTEVLNNGTVFCDDAAGVTEQLIKATKMRFFQ